MAVFSFEQWALIAKCFVAVATIISAAWASKHIHFSYKANTTEETKTTKKTRSIEIKGKYVE